MKKRYYLLLSVIFSLALFTSCDNEILEGEFAASDDGVSSINCEDSAIIFQENALALQNATDENYESVCNDYKNAVEALIDSCQGEFSDLEIEQFELAISLIGDCTLDACTQAETVSTAAAVEFSNATDDDADDLCEAYTQALQAEIIACGDGDGSIQQTINNLPCSGCGAAQADTEAAFIAFDESDPLNETEYELLCGFYSLALQAQIQECGDSDGSLMAIIQDLGDCTPPEEDGPVRLQINGQQKNFNTADVTISGSLLSIVATDIDTGDTFTFDLVLQQTGANVMQDIELIVDGVVHTPFLSGEAPFVNSITENSGSTIVGTFSGTVVNPDGDFVMTSNGIINIVY